MNYNFPMIPNNYNQLMDPLYRIQLIEQELQRLRNTITNLENRISRLEDNKNTNNFNSNVSNKEDGLYML